MLDQVLIIVAVTILILIVPGPDMIIGVRNTIIGGKKAGYQTAAGILAGNLVHIAYCIVGIGWLIANSIVAFNILKYTGAAYLIFLGISSLRTKPIAIAAEINAGQKPTRAYFLQGFINNVLNPKGTLFFLGVFTTVITPETSFGTTFILVSVIVVMCATFWYFFIQTLDTPIVRGFFRRSRSALQQVFGIVFIGLGLRVALLSE